MELERENLQFFYSLDFFLIFSWCFFLDSWIVPSGMYITIKLTILARMFLGHFFPNIFRSQVQEKGVCLHMAQPPSEN